MLLTYYIISSLGFHINKALDTFLDGQNINGKIYDNITR